MNYKKNGELIHIYGLEIGKEFFLIRNRPPMKEDYISGLIGMALDGYGILIAHNPMFLSNMLHGEQTLYFGTCPRRDSKNALCRRSSQSGLYSVPAL